MLPKRWHIYIVALNPPVGTKPGKTRPCLAIQPMPFGEVGLKSTVILPITTQLLEGNNFPLRVRLAKGTAGLQKESEILIDQILAWDNQFFRKELGKIPPALQREVQAALFEFLDLEP